MVILIAVESCRCSRENHFSCGVRACYEGFTERTYAEAGIFNQGEVQAQCVTLRRRRQVVGATVFRLLQALRRRLYSTNIIFYLRRCLYSTSLQIAWCDFRLCSDYDNKISRWSLRRLCDQKAPTLITPRTVRQIRCQEYWRVP